ncbi:unannotated protein [freshwater metagenome]|uniref:Unannotated protein n=1 Tax=freshwater metagenome TaxID=449393 RepID=A0A6J7XSX0_9ZZZZ|nr:hypothetical protein [Actinomycetota bacterium]
MSNKKSEILFFGVRSASFGDFCEVAKSLSLNPLYVDNLPKGESQNTETFFHSNELEKFHFGLPIVISIVTPEYRKIAMLHAIELGFRDFPAFVSPNADIASNATVESGVFVNTSSIIGQSAYLARNCVINRGANVGHDVRIGEFTHVAPSACILGSSKIGANVLVGANSTVLHNLEIGPGAVIGAGAVVIHDVLAGQTVVGNPARVIKD